MLSAIEGFHCIQNKNRKYKNVHVYVAREKVNCVTRFILIHKIVVNLVSCRYMYLNNNYYLTCKFFWGFRINNLQPTKAPILQEYIRYTSDEYKD